MATVSWNPFGVSLNITATGGTVTRKSATEYTVSINVSWACVSTGNKTDYGMTASSGGKSVSLNTQGTKANSGSGTLTGTYSISGNGSATKSITVTFRNYNDWHDDSATKNVTFNVTVPAWTSYTITYNANGGSGAPSKQTKYKGQSITLSSTKPTRTGYKFKNWNTASGGTGTAYNSGATYSTDASATLYAQWTANTFTITYNPNGGTGGPSTQTKTYDVNLTLSTSKPTRTNYTFKGWSTSASSTTINYDPGDIYTYNVSTTLYAVWELAYTKPRITNVRVNRCVPIDASTETIDDEGTYFVIHFDWKTDKSNPTYTVRWKKDAESWNESKTSDSISLTGTSGSAQRFRQGGTVGATNEISVEQTYNVELTVTDSVGSNTVYVDIPSLIMAFDVCPDSITYLRFNSITAGNVNNRIYYDTTKFTHELDKTYTLSFSARSPGGSATLYSCVGGQYNTKSYTLTSSWQSYTFTYTTVNSGSLTFFLLSANTKADITNVEVRESGRMYSLLATNASTSTDYWVRVGSDSTNTLTVETEKMGLGVAIGKTAENHNLFDVGIPARFRGDVVIDGSIEDLSVNDTFSYGEKTDGSYASTIKYDSTNKQSIFSTDSSSSNRFDRPVYISSNEKTTHNDGKTGWYIGHDATIHATHSSGGAGIYFHYAGSTANTSHIKESAKGVLEINGKLKITQNVLWSGTSLMNASGTANLSQAISEQNSGIVLVFGRYEGSTPAPNDNFNTFFIPKEQVSKHGNSTNGYGYIFTLTNGGVFNRIGMKYLYIQDTKITGNANNDKTGTGSTGITYNNDGYVLRYVYGV